MTHSMGQYYDFISFHFFPLSIGAPINQKERSQHEAQYNLIQSFSLHFGPLFTLKPCLFAFNSRNWDF